MAPIADILSLDMIWVPRFSTNITGGTFSFVFYGQDGTVIKTAPIDATDTAATAQTIVDTAFAGYSGYTAGDIRVVDNGSGVTAENTLIYNTDFWYFVFDGPSVANAFWHMESCVGDLTVSSGSASVSMFVLQAAAPGAGQTMRVRRVLPLFSGAFNGDTFEIDITVDGNTVDVPPRTFSAGQSWSLLQADIDSAATGVIPGYSAGDIRVLGRDALIDTTSQLEDGALVLMFQGSSVYNQTANIVITNSVTGVSSFFSSDGSVAPASFGPEKKVAITAPNIFHSGISYRFDVTVDGTTYSTSSLSNINLAGAQAAIDAALTSVPGYVAGDLTVQVVSNWDQSSRVPNVFRFTGASVGGSTSIEAVQLSGSTPSIPFQSIDLTATDTGEVFSVAASEMLSLTDASAANVCYETAVDETISLADLAQTVTGHSATAGNTIALADTAAANICYEAAADNTLTLTDSAETILCHHRGGGEVANISEEIDVSDTFEVVASNTLSLNDEVIVIVPKVVTAENTLVISDTSTHSRASSQAAEDTIGLSDFVSIIQLASNTLNLTDEATLVRNGQRDVGDELHITHAVGYSLIRQNTHEVFSPFVGASTQSGVPDPIDVTEPSLTPGNVSLAFPADSPTTTLELRAPVFGNRDRLSAQRINRQTRGGSLKIFSDPQWPNNHTLVMEFTALTEEQVQAYLDFVKTTLGKEIKLTDHEGRDWRGVITEPEEPIVRNGRKNNSASLVFEGELV